METELRHILEPKLHELSLQGTNPGGANSTLSESISSMTPPLPPLSPGEQSSPNVTPRNSARYKHSRCLLLLVYFANNTNTIVLICSLPYGSKPDYSHDGFGKSKVSGVPPNSRWHQNSSQKHRTNKKVDHSMVLRGKQSKRNRYLL